MKRILTDLYFEGVARIRRALIGTETPLVNSEIGYDNTAKRVRVHDGTSAKKILQENDISTDTALGTSDSLLPSQKAVKTYVDNLITGGGIELPQPFDASVETSFPSGVKGDSYIVTAAGEVQSVLLEVGDWFFAGAEIVAADPTDWIILQRNVDKATTTTAGLIRLATEAEALAGVLDNVSISPKELATVLATIPPPTDGQDGVDGTDGKSAYQIWLDNGNVGTEQVFLDSLVGADGQDGINGTDGLDGTNGVGVPTGGTAGQVLSKIDGTDYNTEWKDESSITETDVATIQNTTTTESDKYVSARRFWNGINTFLGLSNVWTALQTFNSVNTKQIYTTKQTFVITGSNPIQAINLDNGSYIVLDLTGASGTLTLTLNNGKIGGSYWIQVVQALTAVDISLANEGRFDGESGSAIVGVNNSHYCIFPFYTGTGYLLNIAPLT